MPVALFPAQHLTPAFGVDSFRLKHANFRANRFAGFDIALCTALALAARQNRSLHPRTRQREKSVIAASVARSSQQR
jgi:hypothetical protein